MAADTPRGSAARRCDEEQHEFGPWPSMHGVEPVPCQCGLLWLSRYVSDGAVFITVPQPIPGSGVHVPGWWRNV